MTKWLSTAAVAAFAAAGWADTALAQDVTLDLWTIDDPGEYHYVLADEFMAANPDIKINVRTVQFEDMVNDLARAIATGQRPRHHLHRQPRGGALRLARPAARPRRPTSRSPRSSRPTDIFPGPLSSVTYEGGIYGIPRGANTIALYYNADMFKAAGLDPDNPPKTWDELYEAAKALTDPSKNVYGLAFSAVGTEEGTFQFLPWLQMTGGDYDNVDTEGGARALNLWKKILDEKLASPDTLIRGQFDSTAHLQRRQRGDGDLGPVGAAADERRRRSSTTASRCCRSRRRARPAPRRSGEGDNVILAISDNPDEAFKFLEFLYASMDRVWNEFGYLPASKVETDDPKDPQAYAVFEESMKYARNRGPSPGLAADLEGDPDRDPVDADRPGDRRGRARHRAGRRSTRSSN